MIVVPPIRYELPFYPYSHQLDQLYAGLELLKKNKIIELVYTNSQTFQPYNKYNIIKVRVNNSIDVVYDLSDGTDWLLGKSEEENVKYFADNLNADFYFKRSYNTKFHDKLRGITKVFPYGFNYPISSKHIIKHQLVNNLKRFIDYPIFHKFLDFNIHAIKTNEFEQLPIPNTENKVVFSVRLWDPNSTIEKIESNEIRLEREQINLMRVNCIRTCKKEFGDLFIGGVQDSEFSQRYCKDLIQPRYFTNRSNYLKVMHKANICVATTGLHGSIGWKFGEYLAASRAIITEPLNYTVPGNFIKDRNYLEFERPDDLISGIQSLRDNPKKLNEMMFENYCYYQSYLRPDILILNSITKIFENSI